MDNLFISKNGKLIDVIVPICSKKLKKLKRKNYVVEYDDIIKCRIFLRSFPTNKRNVVVFLYEQDKLHLLIGEIKIVIVIGHKIILDLYKKFWKRYKSKYEFESYISDYIEDADKDRSISVPIYFIFDTKNDYLKWKLTQ